MSSFTLPVFVPVLPVSPAPDKLHLCLVTCSVVSVSLSGLCSWSVPSSQLFPGVFGPLFWRILHVDFDLLDWLSVLTSAWLQSQFVSKICGSFSERSMLQVFKMIVPTDKMNWRLIVFSSWQVERYCVLMRGYFSDQMSCRFSSEQKVKITINWSRGRPALFLRSLWSVLHHIYFHFKGVA